MQNLFSAAKVKGDYEISEGKLLMQTEDVSLLLTDETSGDFSFQAKLTGTENGFAGIVSYCDDNNAVALVKEKDKLIFGYLKNEKIISWDVIPGDFSDEIVLQLQRVGNVYQAVYRYDDAIKEFQAPLMANMSIAKAGLICGNGTATFAYACFGNSIEDGHTSNTPITLNCIKNWVALANETPQVRMLEQYNIIGEQKEWEYAVGGIRRKMTEGLSQMAITNKTYTNFKIHGTLLKKNGNGEMGITMLRSKLDETKGDGYILALASDGTLSLKYRNEIIKCEKLEKISNYGLRITIIRMDNRLYIFIGQNRRLFVQLTDVKRKLGYVGFYMEGVSGNINNYMVCDYLPLWLEPISPWKQNMQSDGRGLIVTAPESVMANLRGVAYTNVAVDARVMLDVCEQSKDAYAGLLFAASQDVEPKRGGVLVALNKEGILFISKEGVIKQEMLLNSDILSVYMSVIVQDGVYQVFLPYVEEPVLKWKDETYEGGVVSFVSENSKTGFYHFRIRDLAELETEYEKSYAMYRNGIRVPCTDSYTETDTGNIIYSIEAGQKDYGTYLLEMDVQVCSPEDEKSYPTIYFRSGVSKKLGIYCGGDCSKLVDESNIAISDVAAEALWLFAKRMPNEKWHLAIETAPNKASVKVNDSYVYKDVCLDNCLSGDFSNLPFVPEIVCRQGQEGKTKTIISNIKIEKLQ